MLDDTQSSMSIYPSDKTLSIGDKNTLGINIATNGAAFTANTINIGSSTNKVGIGNTTPTYKLDVNGNAGLCDNLVIQPSTLTRNATAKITMYASFDDTSNQYAKRRAGDIICGYRDGGWQNEYISFNVGRLDGGLETTDTVERMCIRGIGAVGRVGIGTKTPAYTLDVNGQARLGAWVFNTSNDTYAWTMGTQTPLTHTNMAMYHDLGSTIINHFTSIIFRISNAGINGATTNNYNSLMKIHTSGVGIGLADTATAAYALDVASTARLANYVISSDRRIKTSIVDYDRSEALTLFRKFQTKIYDFKDSQKGKTTYGFVAQDVDEIFPYAVDKITDTVSNIYATCPVTQDKITLDTSLLEYDASGHLFPKLKLKVHDKESFVQILKVIDPNTIQIDQPLQEDQVFVYGQEVDDFHTLNKDAIWTVASAALQEVDKQLQQEKTKTQTLQEEVQSLKQGNIQLQTKYEELLARILALESK